MKLHSFSKQKGSARFLGFLYGETRRCVIIIRIRNCFQCQGREKCGAQHPSSEGGYLISYQYYFEQHSLVHAHQLNVCLGWLITSNPQSCLSFRTTFIVPFRICIRYYLSQDQLSRYLRDHSMILLEQPKYCMSASQPLRTFAEAVRRFEDYCWLQSSRLQKRMTIESGKDSSQE